MFIVSPEGKAGRPSGARCSNMLQNIAPRWGALPFPRGLTINIRPLTGAKARIQVLMRANVGLSPPVSRAVLPISERVEVSTQH